MAAMQRRAPAGRGGRVRRKHGRRWVSLLLLVASWAQAQMQVEPLDRGLIAVRSGRGYFLSWRLLADESYATGFNVYRGVTRLNADPLTGATSFTDAEAPPGGAYTVRAVVQGVERPAGRPARLLDGVQGANAGYFDIPLQRPAPGFRGGTYSPNDASVGDLDGDGQYEVVLKWKPSNAKDNAEDGLTDPCLIDAYTLDGAHLWRIDLGRNIRSGDHYTQFMVYDLDGDGKAELMMKTAPGTRDGAGAFLATGPAARADHHRDYHDPADARGRVGRILRGPEYLTLFEGRTGKERVTVEYYPPRGRVLDWGDDYGNRSDRFLAAVAYLDGRRPSAVFQRGYYSRMAMAAYDYRDGRLTRRWVFDTDSAGNAGFRSQGNHQLSVADADADGRHDLFTGGAVISADGKGLHNVGGTIHKDGHGDALHVAHMVKGDPIPYIFMPFETAGGIALRRADSPEPRWYHNKGLDYARGVGAEIDPSVPGFHFWGLSAAENHLYDITGARVAKGPKSCNFVIWWDGDLSRELLSGNSIDKWNIREGKAVRLVSATSAVSVNGSKANPVLQADLFGDWREEIILSRDSTHLRIFSTTMPTPHRLYTLMHDPTYRVAVAWQNTAYNQPPHPGYYLATRMDFPPPRPRVTLAGAPPLRTAAPGRRITGLALRPGPGSEWRVVFVLDKRAEVRLTLQDLQGRQAGRPVHRVLESGAHEVPFQPGSEAEGLYLLRLSDGGATLAERAVTLWKRP